jgi:tRNA threonylcarbamoyladenosine biosynthesis protein TsaB
MKLLAVDTSTERASVALLVHGEIQSATLNSQKTQSQWLLPTIARLLASAEIAVANLDAIVFGCGPGSFTGLRVACSIAKGLAYPYDIGLIPVSTLASIAYMVRKTNLSAEVLAILDARMQEVYWGFFQSGSYKAEARLSSASEVFVPTLESIILAGVGYEAYTSSFSQRLQGQIVQSVQIYPHAAAMIELAQKENISAISVHEAEPLYLRQAITQGDPRG